MGPLGEVLRNSPLGDKIKEREHSNKWDPSVRFFKEPLHWGIKSIFRRGGKFRK